MSLNVIVSARSRRRGNGPEHALIERVAADATDAAGLTTLADGARTLFNCAMPPYDRGPPSFRRLPPRC